MPPAANAAKQATLCAKYDLESCFPGFSAASSVKLGGSVRGYYLRDEPHLSDFRDLADLAHADGSLLR